LISNHPLYYNSLINKIENTDYELEMRRINELRAKKFKKGKRLKLKGIKSEKDNLKYGNANNKLKSPNKEVSKNQSKKSKLIDYSALNLLKMKNKKAKKLLETNKNQLDKNNNKDNSNEIDNQNIDENKENKENEENEENNVEKNENYNPDITKSKLRKLQKIKNVMKLPGIDHDELEIYDFKKIYEDPIINKEENIDEIVVGKK
jgi:hypothetical protein